MRNRTFRPAFDFLGLRVTPSDVVPTVPCSPTPQDTAPPTPIIVMPNPLLVPTDTGYENIPSAPVPVITVLPNPLLTDGTFENAPLFYAD